MGSCALRSTERVGRPSDTKMVVKEEISLLPSSVKSLPGVREGKLSIKRSFHWLLIATLALIFGWLVLLSVRSYQPELSEELVNRLMRGQEARDRRQSVSSQISTIEGDIIVRGQTPGNHAGLSAPLANPNLLWPGGVVEYRFYRTFPNAHKAIVLKAMEYITSKVPCIRFQPAIESTRDYVLILDHVDSCSSDLGRVGGEQVIYLNKACFDSDLMGPVHELLHTLGFVHEHTRPDRDNFISINMDNIEPGKEKNFEKRPEGTSDIFQRGSVNTRNTPYDVLSLLHYGPRDFSKNGEDVLTYLHGLPDQTWPEPDEHDPLSLIDQVELSMAYKCPVSQEKLLQYIHHNRRSNTLLVQHNNKQIDKLRIQNQDNNKQIDQLRTEIDNIKAETSPLRQLMAENSYLIEMLRSLLPVVILMRKQCENPTDYFDKTFAEYQEGFSANGEVWIGLDKLHQLTSERSYSLKIIMTDYDGKKCRAVYEQFEVGPGNGYVLTVGKFNAALSTLEDSMADHNWKIFSTKDRDQDRHRRRHCAKSLTGGWWYDRCASSA